MVDPDLACTYWRNPRLEGLDHDFRGAAAIPSWDDEFVVDGQSGDAFTNAGGQASQDDVRIDSHKPDTKITAERVGNWRVSSLYSIKECRCARPVKSKVGGNSSNRRAAVSCVERDLETEFAFIS
ncbi:MAG: hypothetical protein WAV38_04110 [Xanthobacteraceae bacterium]